MGIIWVNNNIQLSWDSGMNSFHHDEHLFSFFNISLFQIHSKNNGLAKGHCNKEQQKSWKRAH